MGICTDLDFSLAVTKFLIAIGYDGNPVSTSELIDLSLDDDDQCFNWVDYPLELDGATGGLLGNTPLICGGESFGQYIDECYSLNGETSKFVTKMSVKTSGAASIVLNETILWITGGYNGNVPLASSEYIRLSGSSPGRYLPMTLERHVMIAINTTHSMLIGGYASDYLDLTFYFNHGNQQWIDGPRLIQARWRHAVGIVNDQVTRTNLVIITGGWKGGSLDSTEILVDSQWLPGKKRHTVPCFNEIDCMPLFYGEALEIKTASNFQP